MDTRFGAAVSTGDDAGDVARTAAEEAVDRLDADRIDYCQVFCSSAFDPERALAAIRSVVGEDAQIVGCASTGEFTDRDACERGVAVSVVASDTLEFYSGLGTGLAESVPRAVRAALEDVPDAADGYPYRSAVMLHDGLAGVGERVALVTQRKLGPSVQFAGGAASDNYRLEATPVFRNDRVVTDGVVVSVIASENRPVITVEHGHEPISEPMTVTDADGRLVRELDGRPAYEVWKDVVREPVREMLGRSVDDLEPGTQAHSRVMGIFEFGIDQGDSYKIRWPRDSGEERGKGGLEFAVDVPEGTQLRVMRGRTDDQITSAREAAKRAHERAEDGYAGAFVYDCACRKIILGDRFGEAVEAMSEELDAPFAGFETYGETCMRVGEMSGFHNTTTVVQLLPR